MQVAGRQACEHGPYFGPVVPPLYPTPALPLGLQRLESVNADVTSLCSLGLSIHGVADAQEAGSAEEGDHRPFPGDPPWPPPTPAVGRAPRPPFAAPFCGVGPHDCPPSVC